MKHLEVRKMLRATIFGVCMIFGIAIHAQDGLNPTSRTLLQVVWDIGVVDQTQAGIERTLGNDPLSLIELPKVTNWMRDLTGSEMREVAMVIPIWFVLDGSGMRGGLSISVWCDHGGLYLDATQVHDLKKAEGIATVEWVFDGEPFEKTSWTQESDFNFIIPPDSFPHDTFVKRLANARFLILKIRGHAGLEQQHSRLRPANTVIIPVSLSGSNTELLKLIQNCSHP